MAARSLKRRFLPPLTLLFIGLLPLFSVLFTAAMASAFDCRVDEGSVHPCIVAGIDIGGLLYTTGVMGWLMLVSLPLAALALVWLLLTAVWTFGLRR